MSAEERLDTYAMSYAKENGLPIFQTIQSWRNAVEIYKQLIQ